MGYLVVLFGSPFLFSFYVYLSFELWGICGAKLIIIVSRL